MSKFPSGVTISSVLTVGTFDQLWAVPYSKGNVSGTFVTPLQEARVDREQPGGDPPNSSLDLMPAHGLITSGTLQSEKGMSALSIETNIRVFKVIGQARPGPHGPQLHEGVSKY